MNETADISGYLPIVMNEARKLASDGFIVEDLFQEGLIGAMKALASYDTARGSAEAFVRICARNSMVSYLRKSGKWQVESFVDGDELEGLAGAAGGNTPVNMAGIPNPAEVVEAREALLGLIDCLSSFEQTILGAYLAEGSVTRAAARLGCDRKRVDNAIQRIRNKARSMNR